MPNDSAKELPGTAAYREKHPLNWLQNANYNPLYDPKSAAYQANLVNTSKGNAPLPNTYVGGNPNNAVNPNSGAGLKVNSLPFSSAPTIVSNTTVPYGQWIAQQGAGQSTAAPATNPQITLPEAFQQQYNSSPAMQGIKMPDIKQAQGGFSSGSNWNDLLSIARNR